MFVFPLQKVWLTLIVGVMWGVIFAILKYRLTPDWFLLDTINQGVSVTMAVVSFGAAWLFLSALKHFKIELQRAYRLLCVGIVLFGIAQAQFAIVISLIGWDFWINSGLIAIPYLVSTIIIFWAMRRFARLMSVSGPQNSFILATACAFAIALVFTILPHPPRQDELSNDFITALAIWNMVFYAFAAAIVFRIRSVIGQAYQRAMNWLLAGLVTMVVASGQFSVVQLLMTAGDWYYDGSMTILPFLAGAVLLLRAGYEMAVIGLETSTASPKRAAKASTSAKEELPLIDIIVYLSGLVSTPREIDPLLDKMRTVTAKLGPNKHVDGHDRSALLAVYNELETYLVSKERLRNFSQQDIRSLVSRQFALDGVEAEELWH
jgi:hypothetical protein